jgi:hypothetical protein
MRRNARAREGTLQQFGDRLLALPDDEDIPHLHQLVADEH